MHGGYRWEMREPDQPLVRTSVDAFSPGDGEVVVEVSGCGVCHTDLGFLHDGVRTRHELPLALGHEISGRVVDTGPGADEWAGRAVIVPAVMPCGRCDACRAGFGTICPTQKMPGNDIHGGFASHVVVPADGLCHVPDDAVAKQPNTFLQRLSVIADAVSTPFQAVMRSGISEGDMAVVVGLGGVGGFCAQIAAAFGARVIGIDVDEKRLALLRSHGVDLAIDPTGRDVRDIRKDARSFAKENGLPATRWRIFECSGTQAGQECAFGLLNHGAWLGVVGFTRDPVNVRLSNLMAFDAKAEGNWGCLPEHYPATLQLVLDGRVVIDPFVQEFPMDEVNEVLAASRSHTLDRRPVLIP